MARSALAEITLRPITDNDEGFLRLVYAGVRSDELALVDWTDEQKQGFLRMQFDAQHSYYAEHFPEAQFLIIQRGERPVGRLYVDRRETEISIIEIALLPEERNAGIGSALLRQILEEAARVSKPVRIHVERFNPALRLYQRLGFAPIQEQGLFLLMEWRRFPDIK